MKMLRVAAIAALLASAGAAAYAQDGDVLASNALQWREMVPGVSFAPAYGDWEQGAHGKYVRLDPGAQVPMHTHSGAYHGVMISGRMANLYDGGQRSDLSQGDYFQMAERRPHGHQCLGDQTCLFYTYSDALWDIQMSEGQ